MSNKNENTKPLSLVIADFENDLVNKINDSNLPLIVIQPIIERVLKIIESAVPQQLEADRKKYNEELKKAESK